MSSSTAKIVLFTVVTAAALVAGVLVGRLTDTAGTDPNPQLQRATVLYGQERELPEFQLVDHEGRPFGPERLAGGWSVLFFGYTNCPDVCPLTLSTMHEAVDRIREQGEGPVPDVYFVSVDPKRDTLERLSQYVPYFDPSFVGLTGDDENLARLTRALGILYLEVDDPARGDDYLVEHSASLVLINPRGNWHGIFSAPHEPEIIAADFATIRESYEN